MDSGEQNELVADFYRKASRMDRLWQFALTFCAALLSALMAAFAFDLANRRTDGSTGVPWFQFRPHVVLEGCSGQKILLFSELVSLASFVCGVLWAPRIGRDHNLYLYQKDAVLFSQGGGADRREPPTTTGLRNDDDNNSESSAAAGRRGAAATAAVASAETRIFTNMSKELKFFLTSKMNEAKQAITVWSRGCLVLSLLAFVLWSSIVVHCQQTANLGVIWLPFVNMLFACTLLYANHSSHAMGDEVRELELLKYSFTSL